MKEIIMWAVVSSNGYIDSLWPSQAEAGYRRDDISGGQEYTLIEYVIKAQKTGNICS